MINNCNLFFVFFSVNIPHFLLQTGNSSQPHHIKTSTHTHTHSFYWLIHTVYIYLYIYIYHFFSLHSLEYKIHSLHSGKRTKSLSMINFVLLSCQIINNEWKRRDNGGKDTKVRNFQNQWKTLNIQPAWSHFHTPLQDGEDPLGSRDGRREKIKCREQKNNKPKRKQ